jgi:Spy/CpxP family protein refolding chaperone
MWKRTWPILALASVALNVAFIGVAATQVVRTHAGAPETCEPRPGRGEVWCPLHRQLGVTPEQWRRLQPTLIEFHQASRAVREEVGRKREALIGLLSSSPPDRQALAAAQEEVLAGQRRMQQLVVEHLLAEKDVLTPEQEKELFDLIRKRGGCTTQGPLMMGADGTGGGMSQHPAAAHSRQ